MNPFAFLAEQHEYIRADFGLTLLIYVALFVLQQLLLPKPKLENAKPANLGDFNVPTATEDRYVPLIWGTVKVKGPNVVWYDDLVQEAITVKVKTGLFSSEKQIVGFRYKLGMQFGICRGPIDSLLRWWIGEELVFDGTAVHDDTITVDLPNLYGGDKLGNGGVGGTMRLFGGTETQSPSAYLSSQEVLGASVAVPGSGYAVDQILQVSGGTGTPALFRITSAPAGAVAAVVLVNPGQYSAVPTSPAATTVSPSGGTGCQLNLTFGGFQTVNGEAPAYRGSCYLVNDTEPFYFGNSTSIQPWSFEIRRIPTGATSPSHNLVNGADANIANVIYEYLTNDDWGQNLPASKIDLVSFAAAGATLHAEGNGFSMILDRQIEGTEFLRLLEEQMEGVVFFHQGLGKWKIRLARADYDINTVPELTPSNIVEVRNFARPTWRGTSNEVRVEFSDRDDDYKETFAPAQDMANHRLQGGLNAIASLRFPGIKYSPLANDVAWRELRQRSSPLAKLQVVVDRNLFDVEPAQVLAFTNTIGDEDFVKFPVRISNIDYGELDDAQITLSLVEDIFYSQEGAFGDSQDSNWEAPSDALRPFLAQYQLAFEAPRGFALRGGPSADADLIWAGARRNGPEVSFKIVERHAGGTPTGAFFEAGESFAFLLIGKLTSSIGINRAVPASTITITPDPDTQAALETLFSDVATLQDLGVDLVNLLMIDSEFLVASSAQNASGNVQLNNVYGGMLDSVQAAHAANAPVYLLVAGGALTDTVFPAGDNVHVKLLPRSISDEVPEADAVQVALTMSNRVRRPYPPNILKLNGTTFASSASLEGTGSAPENFGILVLLNRRDFRTTDEVAALLADAATIFADYPTANTTFHEVDVRNDPAGTNLLLFTVSGNGTTLTVLRIDILIATDGVLPTTLRTVVRSKHTVGSTIYASRYELLWDFAATCGLTGQFNFTALDTNDVSTVYTATANGTYSFTLSSAFTAGTVEYRLNAGAWLSLITAGNTSGSIPGVVLSDTIEVRHTSTDVGAKKQLDMNAPGAGQDAYALLFV